MVRHRLVHVFLLLLGEVFSSPRLVKSETLYDLRRFRIQTFNGVFPVNLPALEGVMRDRRKQDTQCGNDVSLTLHTSPPKLFDPSIYGKVFVYYYNIDDTTLQNELPCALRDEVATSFRGVGIAIPIQTNENGLLHLIDFVESDKQVILPHTTSSEAVVKIDTIEDGEDGIVTLRKGSDVMVMKTKYNITCKRDADLTQDFSYVTGRSPMITDYPMIFDWKCDLLGWNTSYCSILKEHQCALSRAAGDVCNNMPNSSVKQCHASMQILNMTGTFREVAPFLAETTSVESFETRWVEKTHQVDLTFPCLNTY